MANKKNKNNEPDIIEKKRTQREINDDMIKRSGKRERLPEKKNTDSKPVEYNPPKPPNPDSIGNQAMVFIMAILAIFFAFCMLLTNMERGTEGISGPIGYHTCRVIYGLFGYGALSLPVVFVLYAAFWNRSVAKNMVMTKIIVGMLMVAAFSAFVQVVGLTFDAFDRSVKFWDLTTFWNGFPSRKAGGGGIVGGFIGGMFYSGFKTISLVLVGALLLATVMFMFEITPARLWKSIVRFVKRICESIAVARARAKERRMAEREAAALEAVRLEEERVAAEKEKARREAENAERERIEREKAEAMRTNQEKREYTSEQPKPKMEISYYDSPDKKNRPDNHTEKGVEVTPVDLKEVPNYKKAPDVTPHSIEDSGKDVDEEDVKKIFSEDEDELRPGEFIPSGEKEYDIDGNQIRTERAPKKQKITPEPVITPNEFDDLPIEVMEVERESVVEEVAPPEQKPYELPPIELLSEGDGSLEGDSPEELEANARRLVEVLRSFKVDVEVVHISHGPTITRYEVAPKAGVKVKAISGLVDDIALNMKTSGVRVEPIPGKVAVGIEVPNRYRSTVFLRNLIDTEQFRSAKSKVTCALGVNVAGEPILLDIAKMPHLLIAGATGMGKSVCINSLLVSLLYRATPDEVKLILVDPKKVELNTYNRLPHLLVPVLNEPRKAAGALAWAVIEMERRFSLIEQYGVRNLAGYNAVVAQNEGMEFLPHIIIVIDELADLMMQAKDDVEDSICRLAAKARAAGMHMIVGTQRPSVDVITGLIKANIPSRIAFTVASNTDSRTIIDVAGAEKLVGRGDMLYAPVQEMKPLRLQGSFVSDSEVEKVVSFINDQCEVSYDSDIIEEIEEQAALCGEKKKKGGFGASGGEDASGDAELDSKFYDAVELAVDERKISTSLIQRKLSLGYGRAAKIIDEMEKRGIVSAPDGQKPRTVLISQQDYYEMRIRQNMSETSGSYDD